MSTVKQPDFLHFSKGVYKVLKQIHRNTGIDLGAMYVLEDYNRHLLCSITQIAARLAGEKRCLPLVDYIQAPNKNANKVKAENFAIFGQDSGKYLVSCSEDPDGELEHGWESKHIVEQYLGPQMAEWETKEPSEKKKEFDEWLDKMRNGEGCSHGDEKYYPGEICARDIQTAVRLCMPGELAKHAVSQGTKAVNRYDEKSNDRSTACGLQFDVDQIGALVTQVTSKVVSEGAACYLTAVMEYMTAEALEVSGNAARALGSSWIMPRHIQLAIRKDRELNKIVGGCTIMSGGTLPNIHACLLPPKVRGAGARLDPAKEEDDHGEYIYWVGDNEDEDFNEEWFQEQLEEYREILVVAFENENDERCESILCDWERDRLPEGAWTTETLEAVLTAKFGEKKERIAARRAKPVARRHRRVIRDNIQGITKHHINRLAARGGCVKVSRSIYEEIRGVTKVFLESMLRDTIMFMEHARSNTLAPEHVLSACARQERVLWGTGRLPLPVQSVHPYQQKGPDSENPESSKRGGFFHEFSTRMAANAAESAAMALSNTGHVLAYAKYARRGLCDLVVNGSLTLQRLPGELAQELLDVENSAKERALKEALGEAERAKKEAEAERAQEEEARQEEGYVPPTDKQEKDRRLHSQSLELVRKMQRSTGRVIPFMPLTRLCMEIGQDFKCELNYSPVAINLLGELLETYLVGLFEDSNLQAIHGERMAVVAKDIQMALRIRGERR